MLTWSSASRHDDDDVAQQSKALTAANEADASEPPHAGRRSAPAVAGELARSWPLADASLRTLN